VHERKDECSWENFFFWWTGMPHIIERSHSTQRGYEILSMSDWGGVFFWEAGRMGSLERAGFPWNGM